VSKTYYELLDLPPAASAEDVKKAFRQQIARYHPDKVQHLGKEFQEMAAERAAELTEAYRILANEGSRAEYDRTLGTARPAAATAAPAAAATQAPSAPVPEPATRDDASASSDRHAPAGTGGPSGRAFEAERAGRDDYLRKATLSRFHQALEAIGGGYDESPLRGFEIALVPKSKMFGRTKGPRLLGRFVSKVDGPAVADAWAQAGKWASDDICVFLMGTSLAPARELATAIAEQRRKSRSKVTLIPVDARDWTSHIPTDAPEVAKNLLARLKGGT
jgi:curved DNA-binding protein CbpA